MEFLIGRSLANNITNLLLSPAGRRRRREGEGAAARRGARAGAGRRAGQRRARPAGRVLHRLAGDAADPGHRLRPAVRLRHLPPGAPRRLPGRTAGPLADPARPVGGGPAERDGVGPARLVVRGRTAGRSSVHRGQPMHLLGVPYDRPVVGYGGQTINTLRLWQAATPDVFDFGEFSGGDFFGAVSDRVLAESVTRVLYPDDSTPRGRSLRFLQEYFLVRCSLADIVARFRRRGNDWPALPDKVADPAERHAPGDGRARADAHPARRGEARLGPGVGPDRPHAGVHQPHAAARGPGEVAGRAVRGPAPAAPGDRLRDQPPVPGRRPGEAPRRRGEGSPGSA